MKAGYQFPDTPWMTAQEVAAALRITPNHAYRLAQLGMLPSIRLGRAIRFPTAELKRQAEAHTEKPASVGAETGSI